MKSLFTYPNNSATHFIDPDYIGDDTIGFQKRVKDLQEGTYKTHLNPTSHGSVNGYMSAMARYNKIPELTDGTNNTFYKFWEQPLIDWELQSKSPHVKDISIELTTTTHSGTDYLIPKLRVEFKKDHGFTSGDRIVVTRDNVIAGWTDYEQNDGHTMYAQVINTTEIYLSGVATPSTTPPNPNDFVLGAGLANSRYDTTIFGANSSRLIRYDGSGSQGSMLKVETSQGGVGLVTNRNIRLLSVFSQAHDVGTARDTNQTFYLRQITGTTFSYELFTDAGFTTPATIAENYISSHTRNYTGAATYNLNNQSYTDWGISSSQKQQLLNQGDGSVGNGWCRIIATVNAGTFTGKDQAADTIPTATQYSVDFYWTATNTNFTVNDKRGTGITVQDFILAGTSPDVDIEIKFIDPARTTGGWYNYLSNDPVDEDMIIKKRSDTELFEVKRAVVYNPGNKTYKKRTGASTYVAGAKYKTHAYYPNVESPHTPTAMPADSTIDLNADGYITGFTFPGTYNEPDRGTFTTFTFSQYLPIISADDTYTPPAQTAVEAEDVFDTGTQWADKDFDVLKTFPITVTPSSVTWRIISPTATTVSQSGVKFTRTSGFNKYALDVTYPAMTADQFAEYNGFLNAIRGQEHPFYLNIKQNNTRLIGKRTNATSNLRAKEDLSAGSVVMLIEGFASNQADAIHSGELLIIGGNPHGNVQTSVTACDANIYGEAKFRIAMPKTNTTGVGELVYQDPFHIIVSLDSDTVEVQRDTAGFYYLSFTATADGFK
jgi:hypothetical protein